MLRMTTLDQSYPSASIPLRPDARCAPQAMISCVVPAFNEHENLGLLLPRLQAVLTQACQNWEVVVVDDGSRDPTSVLMSTWTQIPGFRYVQLSRNFGKEPAITAGLEAARGDAVGGAAHHRRRLSGADGGELGCLPRELRRHCACQCGARGEALARPAQRLKRMKPMKAMLLLLALSLGLAACGVRGDPEPPPATEQTQ